MRARKRIKPPVSPHELKQMLELPPEAVFVGYCVHLEEREEFLASETESNLATMRAWTKTPGLALFFHRFDKAHRSAMRYGRGAVVVYVFDLGDGYFVVMPD